MENTLAFEQIKTERDYYANIIQNAPVLICGIDRNGITTFINPVITKITGYRKDELIGKRWWKVFYPGEESEQVNRLFKAFVEGEVVDHEMRLTCKNGDKKHIVWNSFTKRDENNNILEVFGFGIDITERKQAEERLRVNEERLELAMSGANDGIWDWDMENKTLHFDSRYYTMAGYEPDEFPGMFEEWEKRVHPDDIQQAKSAIEQYLAGKRKVYEVGFRFLRKEGYYMWIRGRGKVVARDEKGKPTRFIGTHSNITELKRIEKDLQESLIRFSGFAEATQYGFGMADLNATITYVNTALCRMLGEKSPEDAVGQHFPSYYPPEMVEKMKNEVLPTLKRGGQWQGELELLGRDGRRTPVLENYFILNDEKGNPRYLADILTDITERKRAEEALRKSEQLLSNVFESMQEGVLVLDTVPKYTYWNRRMEEISHAPREEVLGTVPWEKFPFLHGEIAKAMKNAISGDVSRNIELKYSLSDGKEGWTTESYFPLKDSDGRTVGAVGVIEDITERKRAEEELRNLRNYLSNIIDSMPSVLIGVDIDGRVTQWNKKAEQTTGITAVAAQGKTLSDVFPQIASEMEKITQSIRTKETIQERKGPRLCENGTCYEDVTIYPLATNGVEGAVIRIDDVTEKVRMEEMMIQSEKMLSVGGLAAGMAHEINNPLAGMLQTADVMANRLGKNMDMPANLKAAEEAGITMEAIRNFMEARGIPGMITTIMESGRRVAAIVSNMLSFARKGEAEVSPQALAELLDKTLALAATDYDLKKQYDFKRIEVKKEYEDNLPPVPCEGPKIQQVLLNILRNGAQAMQEAGTGKPRFIVRTWFEKEREMVCLEIEDNGPGMDEATRRRVFEPFYTTKPAGVGTGLGLSVSYFIITENHSGEMAVESLPGSGTKFIIRLPVERE